MKFGRQFESYKIPEWFEYYLDYNKLKTVLKFIDNRQIKRKKLKKLKMMKSRYDKKKII
jgi:SPX domain protein involved in polyphosphate accumulation